MPATGHCRTVRLHLELDTVWLQAACGGTSLPSERGPMRVESMSDIASAVRGRRLDLGLSQSELARRSGISRKWISEFEAEKPRAEFALVLRVLTTLGLSMGLDEEFSAAVAVATKPAVSA